MPSDFARVERAIHFIDSNADAHPDLDAVADAIGLSPFHAQRLFQRWAGVSPKRFLQALTVERAKPLLVASNGLLQTSLALGLSGPGRLHDLFLRVEAMTPGEFSAGGERLVIRWGVHETPFGRALFASTERGLCHVAFLEPLSADDALDELRRRWPNAELRHDATATRAAAKEIDRRMRGQAPKPLGVLLQGTPFQLQVWQALLRVSPGATTTYGALADVAGRPGSSRAVGNAVGANPIGWLIPCHRVIQSTGALGGYRWGSPRKRSMLALEQARVSG